MGMDISKIKIHDIEKDYIIDLRKRDIGYDLFKQLMPWSIMKYAHGTHLIANNITILFGSNGCILIVFENEMAYNRIEIKLKGDKKYIKFNDFFALLKMSQEYTTGLPFNDDFKQYEVKNNIGNIRSKVQFITEVSRYDNKYRCTKMEVFRDAVFI